MNFLGKILKNRQWLGKIHYHLGKNSAADWLLIVLVFVVLSVVFVAMAFYQFSNYRKSDAVVERSVAATSTAAVLDHAKLDAVVRYFAEREQKFNEIKAAMPRFADPSR